jgi:uncharacterized phage-like protein YoqJ
MKKGGGFMTVCCFTGHRVIPFGKRAALSAILDRRIAALFDVGFTEFRAGGALGFDTLAAERVLFFKQTHPECHLHLLLPCRDHDKSWSAHDRAVLQEIVQKADSVRILSEYYRPDCMHARNRALVEGSDLCLAYLTKNRGGTLYTCSYALKNGVRLINLADEIE